MNTNELGERIRKARRERDMTQADLAEACDCTPGAISRYESGERVPSLPVALCIAKRLGINLEATA